MKRRLINSVRWFGRSLELIVAFLFVYLVVAIYGAVIPVGQLRNQGDVVIFVQSNGVHTDVCLPVETKWHNWLDFIPIHDYPSDAQCEFVVIGWGDKGFFLDTPTWAELKVSTALNAAFLPSDAAMHVAYCRRPEENANHYAVHLSAHEYKELVKYVQNSFLLQEQSVEILPNAGYTPYDRFYEAGNSYHLFNTCNSWTNGALKAANVKTGIFALFPDGIISHLER